MYTDITLEKLFKMNENEIIEFCFQHPDDKQWPISCLQYALIYINVIYKGGSK